MAVKKLRAVSPGTTLTSSWVGTKLQGKTSPTVESNRTVMSCPWGWGRNEASFKAASSSVHVLAPRPCDVEEEEGNMDRGTLEASINFSHNCCDILERPVTSRSSCASAQSERLTRWVVPPNPVVWQNTL